MSETQRQTLTELTSRRIGLDSHVKKWIDDLVALEVTLDLRILGKSILELLSLIDKHPDADHVRRQFGLLHHFAIRLVDGEETQLEKEEVTSDPAPLDSPLVAFLIESYVEDYYSSKLLKDDSGWRTLMDAVRQLRIPRSHVYGDQRCGHVFSRSLEALISLGLVEHRKFSGERGRGGCVSKLRVCCDRGEVRNLVSQAIRRRETTLDNEAAPWVVVSRRSNTSKASNADRRKS